MMPYRENTPPPKDPAVKERDYLAEEKKALRRATIWSRIALGTAIFSGIAQLVGCALRHFHPQ